MTDDYIDHRKHIGAVHARVDLPTDIYLVGMSRSLQLLIEALEQGGAAAPPDHTEDSRLDANERIQLADKVLTACESGDFSELEFVINELSGGVQEKALLADLVDGFDLDGTEALARTWKENG